ncbi:MAG: N-formylglutamate amidohydrolase [Rhizobiaceae bacterium]|nr:N-formylglutamate amidohydrolase [Rhizobiaceae bacterium]
MSAEKDFASVAPYTVQVAGEQRVPFVFNSPHSGHFYPQRFLAMSRLDPETIRRSEDCYVDELFGAAPALGAPMLSANFPRAYLDVNREPWELDPRMFVEPLPSFANVRSARVAGGLGTVPKLVGEGLDIYPARLPLAEATQRIEAIYKPYHETLKRLLARTHARFGLAVLIDCHSMPAGIRVGETGIRPDFIVGDRFGTSAAQALTDHAIGLLRSMGYTVAHNKPYAGGFITEHYGRPARGLHALQIEINRGLYMDERNLQKSAGFDALTEDLARFSSRLLDIPDQDVVELPIAAE